MTAVRIHPGEWVVVCDGTKALVLENVGDEKFPNLTSKKIRKPTSRALTRRAARSIQSMLAAARWSRRTGIFRRSSGFCRSSPYISMLR
jgi:protein required for attachment to host cells